MGSTAKGALRPLLRQALIGVKGWFFAPQNLPNERGMRGRIEGPRGWFDRRPVAG